MKKVLMSLTFTCVLTIGIANSADAKFWGWETLGTTDWSDGTYTYRETCRVHYILWISGSEECSTEIIAGPYQN